MLYYLQSNITHLHPTTTGLWPFLCPTGQVQSPGLRGSMILYFEYHQRLTGLRDHLTNIAAIVPGPNFDSLVDIHDTSMEYRMRNLMPRDCREEREDLSSKNVGLLKY